MYNKVSTAIKEIENTVKPYSFYINIFFFSAMCPFLHIIYYALTRLGVLLGRFEFQFFHPSLKVGLS